MALRNGALRVTFIIPGFADGGAQKQCIYLLNELKRRSGIELSLIRFHVGEVHDHLLQADGIRIHDVSTGSNYDPRNVLAANSIVRRERPDILLSWLHSCDLYSYAIRRMNPQLKWIMTERNSRYPAGLRYRLREWAGQSADAIVSNSMLGQQYWARLGARGKSFVVRNILPAAVTQSERRDRDPRLVLYAGRLEEQKNVLTVARAFCILAYRRPDLSFSLIGKGTLLPQVEAILAEHRMSDRIALLGFRQDAVDLIARAGVLVTLSHHEGLPNVVLEAVAGNTPVVASDIAEHREVLGDSYTFLVPDRHDPVAAAEVIEAALTPGADEALAEAQTALAQMTPAAVGDRYIEIFEQVVAQRG